MKKPLFSICIPNYNYAHYIKQTIDSVLNQNYSDFEIIIADNASTDNSVNVINSYNDDRIRLYVNKYNVGFGPNLDKATLNARGHYIILLSSDDLMKPGALLKYSEIINQNEKNKDNLMIMSGCDVINSENKVIGEKSAMTGDLIHKLKKDKINFNDKDHLKLNGLYILEALLNGKFQPAGQFLTTCFSKKLYDDVEGYNSIMSIWPDANFSHKILFQNPDVIYINQSFFAYRVHSAGNLSATLNFNNIKHLIDGYLLTFAYSEKELEIIGKTKNELQKTFVNKSCLNGLFYKTFKGDFQAILRTNFFLLSAFPNLLLSNIKFYILVLLIPLVPFFKLTYSIYKFLK